MNPLANALMNQEKIEAQNQINPQFPHSATHFIATALDDGGQATAQYIAAQESNHALMQQRELKAKLESGFAAIHLGKHQEETNLEGQCFWVPASVRHDVQKDDTTGLARYSFFVYGGVSVQPRVNVVAGRNGPLDGSRVSSGAFNRKEITRGFQSHHIISPTNKATKNHELLQLAGFNNKKDMNSQTNRIYLPDGRNSQHPNRSIHSGRHTQLAMNDVAHKMDFVARQGRAQNWTQGQYRAALRTVLSEMRQDLRGGKTNLYAKSQPK
ncbi:AHH domain-containing protein [Legionella fairfieldensis]|uniref:AHH domain-containing protein n=1 Tax=Legionella fairfieldensis TaxID=45064 RepID=UPI0010410C6C|nr:AHH domain-containing protein [Legionella fairfieldensis]